jgi:site-specific recombinase XerD
VRSRRGLSSNSERAYRNDLAGFVRRLADAQGIYTPELPADDPWGRQKQQLARIDHRAFTDENLAFVFGQMVADGAATASRARMLSAIRGFCQWMVRSGHLELDPTLGFETPQPDKKLPVALTDGQLAAVVHAAARPRPTLRSHWAVRDVAMIGVLAGCGIRSAELTELRIKDIQRAEPHRIRVLGKGAKERIVPLSPEVLRAVDHYLADRSERAGAPVNSDSPVFVRPDGGPLNNRGLQRLVANWLAAAGVPAPPGEKAHLFRHTYGIGQVDRGTSLPELQLLMGHENVATTGTYLRVAAEGLHHTARATAVNSLVDRAFAVGIPVDD